MKAEMCDLEYDVLPVPAEGQVLAITGTFVIIAIVAAYYKTRTPSSGSV